MEYYPSSTMDVEMEAGDTSSKSSSSDSELETKIKFTVKEPIKKTCIFCLKSGNLIECSSKTFKTFVSCLEKRETITKKKNVELSNKVTLIETGDRTKDLVWHILCYSSFTSKQNIINLEKKMLKEALEDSNSEEAALSNTGLGISGMSLRKTNYIVDRCVFCQKTSKTKRVCQVMTICAQRRIQLIANKNPIILERIGANDLIAMEVKYHGSCFASYWKKLKHGGNNQKRKGKIVDVAFRKISLILEKGFKKQNGFGTTNIFKKYQELGGLKSKRQLIRQILYKFSRQNVELIQSKKKNEENIFISGKHKHEIIQNLVDAIEAAETESFLPVMNAPSDVSVVHKMCCDIKIKMDSIPDHKQYKNLDIADYKQNIPDLLYWLVSMLVSNDDRLKEIRTLSICQDIIYTYSKGRTKTPKHIGFGIMLHQETKSKKIIEDLHTTGHCVSYKDVLRIRNTIAQEELYRYAENFNTVIPRQLVSDRFVQLAADNIDILEETLDKAPTFHATQMIAFQQGPSYEESEKEFNLLPYKIKLNIPENFRKLAVSNCHKNTKIIPIVNNKHAFNIVEDKQHTWSQNISWILCRLSNSHKLAVPQWSGFHKLILSENPVNEFTTTYGYLPLIPHVSTEYDTVWTIMNRCQNIATHLKILYTVITFDQAIYFKAKELQWLKAPECEKFIFRLGGFHIMLNFIRVIGQHMQYSGLKDVWLESGLYGESTVDGILNGKKWNKAIRAHKLTYESVMEWLMECNSPDLEHLFEAKFLAEKLINNILEKNRLNIFDSMKSQANGLLNAFKEFVIALPLTLKLWTSYLELVEILLDFLYSERTGNWNLHLETFRKMLPWFFAYDHSNYARWGSVYFLDMLNLPSYVQNEFYDGQCVVKRLPGVFNNLSVDQALEHVNKRSKDAGGIVGLTKNSTRLDEWFLSFNEIGNMVQSFQSSLNLTSSVSQNIEVGSQRIKLDEQTVLTLQKQLCRFQIFSHSNDNLICISTNEVIADPTASLILNAKESGECALSAFIQNIDTPEFYKPIKKQNILKSHTTKPATQKPNKTKDSQLGQTFLQRVLAAKEMGRHVEKSDIFSYELTTYPMSLSVGGDLLTPNNKSSLGKIIEEFTTPVKELPVNNSRTCHIFDAMSVVQSLGKPALAKNFSNYGDIFNSIIFRNKFGASRIDIVFDHYKTQSIKNSTRLKRNSSGQSSIHRIINSPDTLLPQQWHLFIHSSFNKQQLTNLLSNYLFEHQHNTGLEIVTSGGFTSVLEYRSNFCLDDDILQSTHEEADTRLLLHVVSAKKAGYTRAIIDCIDTDVLVLLVRFKDQLTEEIWLKVGKSENMRLVPVHEINMDLPLVKTLPAFHALTGCDTTSQFNGIGKKTCWKIYVQNSNLLDRLGIGEFGEEHFEDIHKFVIKLYTKNEMIKSVNELRASLSISRPIDKLPPTTNSLFQHCLRAHYQTNIWLSSLNPQPKLPDVSKHGWTIKEREITPVLQTLPPIPEETSILTTCKCKKDCFSKLCSCKKNKMECILSCACLGTKACKNSSAYKKIKVQENLVLVHREEENFEDSD